MYVLVGVQTKEENMKERIKWIDVMKFFGIFEIYLGHFGAQAGRAGDFVWGYHVAMFFLISGCMENLNTEDNIVKYAIKKVKTILVPCFFFACLTVALGVIQNGYGLGYIKGSLILIAKGIVRNSFENVGLWFLTCLFSIQIIFFLIRKLKYKPLILMGCFGLYYVALVVLPVNPMYSPSWFYNVDSALFYILYYAIGYVAYPYIVKLFVLDTIKKKVIFGVSGLFALAYTIGAYFGLDLIASTIMLPPDMGIIYSIFSASVIIWAHFIVARLLQEVKIFVEIGKNTLYLCGNEYIVKSLVADLATLFGIHFVAGHPIQIYLYVGILLLVINRCFVPVERYLVGKVVREV